MENAQIDDVARLLKSIAHPIRLKILCLLQDGELSVGDLLATVQTTNGNLSQHLAILRHQGIIVSRKEANFIYNCSPAKTHPCRLRSPPPSPTCRLAR